jgi:hypothetical protein
MCVKDVLLTAFVASVGGLLSGLVSGGNARALAQAKQVSPRSVEAREFRLIDANGKTGAVLGFLRMASDDGTPSKDYPEREPGLILTDAQGRTRAGVALSGGAPGVSLLDKDGRTVRAWLALIDDSPALFLHDQRGNIRCTLALISGEPRITMKDGYGGTRGWLGLLNGQPGISFYGVDGHRRVLFGTAPVEPETGRNDYSEPPSLLIFGAQGQPIWRAP